jgi:hypothetical protein
MFAQTLAVPFAFVIPGEVARRLLEWGDRYSGDAVVVRR